MKEPAWVAAELPVALRKVEYLPLLQGYGSGIDPIVTDGQQHDETCMLSAHCWQI